MKTIALFLIRVYQIAISPLFGNSCRFYPTCSAYTYEALQTHGFIKGTWLGIKRLSRCHPWTKGGIDPVPQNKSDSQCHTHSH
ncbi:MAG: membrane protein insertion efficiency factor YidD [Gammaproteobacteria bacterium]|nr:MAG: membrane protein insertion efficiency factor YidD [Pseudomonadota bacterium]PIE38284.1 MAG: membrane protein insertion efficiency factor YidD [Gammaproteobacteria bacterium]